YIPITFVEKELRHSVACAYLVMRAVDAIEDHEEINNDLRHSLLMQISELLNTPFDSEKYLKIIDPVTDKLPEVSLRLVDWLAAWHKHTRAIVRESSSEMAYGMAKWAKANWRIKSREDLDDYTYYVGGLVYVMLSKLWDVCANVTTDRDLAIGYGRGLQAVNILESSTVAYR